MFILNKSIHANRKWDGNQFLRDRAWQSILDFGFFIYNHVSYVYIYE